MLYIHYNQTKPNETAFEYAIQGNNDVDVVCFDINDIHLDFTPSHIYAKVQSKDKKYTDKIELTESNGVLNWHLLAKTTRHKVVYVQLSFETTTKYFQTEMVELTLKPYINAEQEIENDYPMVLQDLQRQIDEMGGGGGATSVEIEKVWLTYDDKKSIRADILGTLDEDGVNFVNDSTRIWVNFKTTPISAKMEEEIKNGRFIIRLDYPNKNRSEIKKQVNGVFKLTHQPQAKNGVGSRSYSRNFLGGKNPMSEKKKQILLNSLIFVNEEDIKANRYGEKYVHKKVSFYDYVNNICGIISDNTGGLVELSPITNEWINNDNDGKFIFADYLDNHYACGIPHTYVNREMDMLDKGGFSGTKRMKMYVGIGGFPMFSGIGITNSVKLNPAFTCYCLLKTPEEQGGNHCLYSPYFVGKNQKEFTFASHSNGALIISNCQNEPAGKRVTKKAYMSARPRCAILNDDYENSSYAFLKTYPQSEQQIRLYCKNMLNAFEGTVGAIPIFRMIITQK